MHVGASQVERPGYIVEGRHEHAVGMLGAQGLADACNLVGCALAGIRQVEELDGVLGDGRTVVPYQAQRVEVGAQGDAVLLTQVGNELSHGVGGAHRTVDAYLGPVLPGVSGTHDFLSQPLRDGGCAGHLELHELELGAPQLFLGGEEIAGVGPEGCRMEGDHGGACRAVETRYKLTPLPMVGDVLTLMRVCAGEDEGCQMLAPHHFP